MTDRPIDDNAERPPAAAFEDPSIRGTRCQEQLSIGGKRTEPRHDGCPGWWPGLDGEAGFSCGCACHDERGWPGWKAHQSKGPEPS